MLKKKKTKKKIIIISIIVIIIGILIFKPKEDVISETKIELEEIKRRDIATSISATGKITTENTQSVVAALSGVEVATVNVKEGDTVSIGDVICTFDMSNIQSNLSDAKSSADIAKAQSNLSIEAAQRSLNDAINHKDTELANVRNALQSAEQAYVQAQSEHSTISSNLATKQNELQVLINNYTQTQTKLATLDKNDSSYEELRQNLQQMDTQKETLSTEIAELQSTLTICQTTLNELKSAYDAAVANYNSAANSIESNIAALQDNVKNAELSAQSSNISQKAQLTSYEEQLEKGIVTALTAGTISGVNVKVGDIYAGTPIATINGVEQLMIEAQIDEYDIPDISIGMKVLIKTDATREEELHGTITYVATTASTASTATDMTTATGNFATYLIKIKMDEQNERLRLGMNAKLSIITNMATNAWSVPYDCVQEREDGSHYIEIAKDDTGMEKEEINVEPGIEGSYYVEVQSNQLKEGMKVILPAVDTSSSMEDLLMNMGADGGM